MSMLFKGNSFENQVFKYLQTELSKDNLFVPQKLSTIFQKKAYFSRDRGSTIVTDISIETSMPNATNYSLLTIVECKDYSNNIPVDDIEEFHSKVQQISGDNVKAIFTTTSALQRAALAFARSKQIAVIRLLPNEQVQWIIYHMTPDMLKKQSQINISEFDAAFLKQNHVGINRNFYGCIGNHVYDNLFVLLKAFLNEK